jgi:dephospho-CoA kinase
LKHNSPITSEQILRQWCIALTGGIASGKSEVAGLLRSKGFLVIDADDLARQVVEPGQPALNQIQKAFNKEAVITPDGRLDRNAMREHIFRNPGSRATLERITHPAIRTALMNRIQTAGLDVRPGIFFYEAALIFEKAMEGDFREVWVMECPVEVQVERLSKLRAVSQGDALRIISAQIPASERKDRASKVIHRYIHTGGDLQKTREQVESALAALGVGSLSSR